jgi:hypothetical protein
LLLSFFYYFSDSILVSVARNSGIYRTQSLPNPKTAEKVGSAARNRECR